MITRLFRINHWRARARFWRQQAESAKREVARLQLSLLAERYRNLNREDYFVSAAVMGGRGMVGIVPRSGPAVSETPRVAPPAPDPYNLSGADLMEFDLEWKPLAEAQGISMQEAKRQFVRDVVMPRRIPLNDDPFSN